MLTDKELLDAIGDYGLTLVTEDVLTVDGEWQRTWVCACADLEIEKDINPTFAHTIREAISQMVHNIKSKQN